MPPAGYQGYYINLDRSPVRRARMDADLARFGLLPRYSRLPASDGKLVSPGKSTITPGQLGCFHSHMRALEEARGKGLCVHVLEDDAILSEHVAPVIGDAVATGYFERNDILFTDTFVDCNVGMLRTLRAIFEASPFPLDRPMTLADLGMIGLDRQNFACLTSYVVGARSIEKILALYREALASGPRIPVDLFIRDCVHAGRLRANCVFPFITSLALDEILGSTIDERDRVLENPSVMVLAVLRYSFFVERNLDLAQRHLDAVTKAGRAAPSAHHALIAQAVEYALSDDYREF